LFKEIAKVSNLSLGMLTQPVFRSPTPSAARCKQRWQLGDVCRYAPSFIEG
jgi:hypothetical protein